jgi:hypothetical protein
MGSANNDTKRDFELRIMPSDDQWYWEVITENRRVVAPGLLTPSRGKPTTPCAKPSSSNRFPKALGRAVSILLGICRVVPTRRDPRRAGNRATTALIWSGASRPERLRRVPRPVGSYER